MTVGTFTEVLNQLLPEPHAGLLNGILFGTKAAIPKDLMDSLISTGTLHIVALSGMNITILESLIARTLGYVLHKRATSVLTILLIIGFVLFVGPSPSVIRAAIMGSLTLLAIVFGRQRWGIAALIITGGSMLFIHPTWITDLSFELSFLATLGILLFAKETSGKGNVVVDNFRLTLAAQTFTVPLIFFTFHRISLISPVTNVLIGWIIQPLTALGLITALFGWVWLPLGQIFAWVAWVMLQYLIFVISWTAKLPFSSVAW